LDFLVCFFLSYLIFTYFTALLSASDHQVYFKIFWGLYT
jgi:hypothetical protein